MVGGGVTFGPQPRSYEKKVNKKVRNLALRSALSAKVAAGEILVLDGTIEAPKTKTIIALTNALTANTKQLFVVNDLATEADYNLYLSARNLENAVVLQPNEIGVYWLLKQRFFFFMLPTFDSRQQFVLHLLPRRHDPQQKSHICSL